MESGYIEKNNNLWYNINGLIKKIQTSGGIKMAEAFSGNLKVSNLLQEIQLERNRLQDGMLNKRSMRQILDAEQFIKMVKRPPFSQAITVSDLKKIIQDRYQEYKENISIADTQLDGHQFTFFDTEVDEPSEAEKKEIAEAKEAMEQEKKWLHKCLGICTNKQYFR